MKEFLFSKEKQGSVCAFFAMLVAMCIVGSYYLQYSSDLYWIKLFTNILLISCSGYLFISSMLLNDKNAKNAALGLIIVLLFSLLESVFWILKRAEWRMTAEALALAMKAFGVFTMLDVIAFNKSFIKKWWYVLLSVLLLLIPAILKSLPLNFSQLTNGVLALNIELINVVFNISAGLFGLVALLFAVVQIVKKRHNFIAWSSACYSLSVLLYGVFGVLRQAGINATQWSKNTSIVFELGVMLLLIAISTYNKPASKRK